MKELITIIQVICFQNWLELQKDKNKIYVYTYNGVTSN